MKQIIWAIIIVFAIASAATVFAQYSYQTYSPYQYHYYSSYTSMPYYSYPYYSYPARYQPYTYRYYPTYSPLSSQYLYQYGLPQSIKKDSTVGQLCGLVAGGQYGCESGLVCDYKEGTVGVCSLR